jgi:hypothetical protein
MRSLQLVPDRSYAALRDIARRSPGTLVYVLVLVVTTAVVRSTSPSLSNELLRQVSTNLEQMGRSAGRVLLLSGFLLGSSSIVPAIATLTVVYVPLERWIGSWRWLSIVVVGHVGATLVTTVGIWADVRNHRGATALVQAIDVGPSYGLMAATAFLLTGVPRRGIRIALIVAFAAYLIVPFVDGPTFTDTGHAAAACIGAAMWLLVPANARTAPLVSPLRSLSATRKSPAHPQPRTAP